jgi:hypothetical protein
MSRPSPPALPPPATPALAQEWPRHLPHGIAFGWVKAALLAPMIRGGAVDALHGRRR